MEVARIEPAGRSAAQVAVAAHPRVRRDAVAPPGEDPVPDSKVRVEVERRDGGAQVVTVVDSRAGEPICQLPPEQVVQVVENLLLLQRARRERDGAAH
ncbi:MAG: hypothetical protein ACOYY2_02535 [Actinomycetota bacterium]